MKKLFTFFVFILLAASTFYAGDRMVIIERFTSWTCGPCASNNPTMEAFINGLDADKIVGIAYHMNWLHRAMTVIIYITQLIIMPANHFIVLTQFHRLKWMELSIFSHHTQMAD